MTNRLYTQYSKEQKLGEGTYAVVYKGTAIPKDKKQQKRTIAIKQMKLGQLNKGLDISAIREIKYLQELKHENILELIDVFCMQSTLNLVLEYLESDLEMIIKNTLVVFSSADVKSWMLMLFRGLHHIHRNFILHRDLKPNNLLLAKDGQLKIADFGLACMYGETRAMTSQVVTRWYRSPELLLGAKLYGTGVDMWAAGCILAELMVRAPFFAAETDIGQLNTIFSALGTPTEQDWPEMKYLPDYHAFNEHQATPLSSIFNAASHDTLDLLSGLVKYNPLQRLTAEECLKHDYFVHLPRPTPPSKLPTHVVQKKRKADDELPKIAKRLF